MHEEKDDINLIDTNVVLDTSNKIMDNVKNSISVATGAFVATQVLSTGLKHQYSEVNWNHWGWSTLFSAFGGAVASYSLQKFLTSKDSVTSCN